MAVFSVVVRRSRATVTVPHYTGQAKIVRARMDPVRGCRRAAAGCDSLSRAFEGQEIDRLGGEARLLSWCGPIVSPHADLRRRSDAGACPRAMCDERRAFCEQAHGRDANKRRLAGCYAHVDAEKVETTKKAGSLGGARLRAITVVRAACCVEKQHSGVVACRTMRAYRDIARLLGA